MPWYVTAFVALGTAFAAAMAVAWVVSPGLREVWPATFGVAGLAVLLGATYFVLLYSGGGEQERLRARVETKYAATLAPDADLSKASRHGEVDVVGRVDGQEMLCTVEVVQDEPYVFCGDGHGVEADRR